MGCIVKQQLLAERERKRIDKKKDGYPILDRYEKNVPNKCAA